MDRPQRDKVTEDRFDRARSVDGRVSAGLLDEATRRVTDA